MDLTPEQLQSTLAFLHTLAVYPRNLRGDFSDNALFTSLINHLKADGYGLQSFDAVDSRRLSGEVSGSSFYMDLALIFMCVLCAGLASGLTQGLLSLDFLEMKIKSQSGTPKEKEYATKVIPIIKHHHLLLVTLMLWNASATEALPIFLNSLVPEVVAIIISVTLVLMFGEIIPASILTGPKQLEIAASLTPLVYFVYVIFFPIAYPISKLLDYIIGHEEGMTLYSRREIATMMKMQHEEAARRLKSGDAVRDSVHNDEMTIIGGALKFRDMKASDVMTTLENVFMLSAKENLSYKTLYEIFKAGYSRIPVYDKDKNDIIGLLLAKDLIFVDPEDETPINNFVEFFGRRPVMVWHDQLLGEILSTFRRERAHLAIVRDVVFEGEGDPYYKVVGIITLEDIIEEILGAEIEDEFDAAEGEGDEHWHLRDMDLARLKSLRSKITDDSLSEDEINAIVSFLPKNVPQVVEYSTRYKLQLSDVIKKSHVFLLKKQTPEGASKPHPNDVIVRKGKFTNTCILILQGRVKVVQELEAHEKKDGEKEGENDVVRTEQIVGPWSTLCADALLSSDGSFAPSFSAYIYSNDLRFLRISTIFSSAYSLSHTRFVDKKRQHVDLGVQRVRIASSPDSNYINLRGDLNRLSRNKTHNGEVKTSGHGDHGSVGGGDVRESISGGGTESFLLRRSITADPAFRPSRALSGTDESLAWSGNDRKSVLLANMAGPGNAGRNSFPAPGSSYRSEYEPIDVSGVSVSQKKGGLKKERPPVSNNVVVSDAESSTSDNSSSSSSTTAQKRAKSPDKTPKTVVTGNSLLTPLIRQDEKEEGDSTVVNKLHENK